MKRMDTDITKAATLEEDFYALESSFKDTLENVFAKNWQLIADDSKLKENKNALPFQFLADLPPEPHNKIDSALVSLSVLISNFFRKLLSKFA